MLEFLIRILRTCLLLLSVSFHEEIPKSFPFSLLRPKKTQNRTGNYEFLTES